MSKRITVDDDVYELLSNLKESAGDSFSQVLRRHFHNNKTVETAGKLLAAYENEPPPKASRTVLSRMLNERGRQTGGRK